MPELPEVETVVRTLEPQVTGKVIRSMSVLLPKALQGDARLFSLIEGSRIESVRRRAKLLLLALALPDAHAAALAERGDGAFAGRRDAENAPVAGAGASSLVLAFHLKMTGSFFVHPCGTPPLKHTRLIFDLEEAGETAGRLFFDDMRTFGYCRVMRPGDLAAWPFWASLGPEPLEGSPHLLAGRLAEAFRTRRGAVKAVLLDQSVLAGVGNIYADESLFKAGIRPDARADSLSKARLLKLAEALQDILTLSIRECGSSIRDYRDANGNAGAFQNSFAVYGRKGEPCTHCGKPLEGLRIAGRATVFCPHCQSGSGSK